MRGNEEKMAAAWLQRESRFCIDAASGQLEILVNGVNDARGMALVCHPHPLHGGSMDNKVVFTLARALRDSGFTVVRFNCRGVGNSEGVHDQGRGELEDAQLVLRMMREQAGYMPLVLAGFSFGAALAAQLAQTEECKALILAAPPVPRYGMDAIVAVAVPVLLLQGEDDEIIDSTEVFRWYETLAAQRKTLWRRQQAGHFFHGLLPEIKLAVTDFLATL